jgi:Transcription factor S-II (TFIIS), central domain
MLWHKIPQLVSSLGLLFSLTYAYHQPAIELIQKRAQGVESAVYNNLGGTTADYKAKIRSLFVNLKDKNNPALRESIVTGSLSVEKFSKMTSEVCPDPFKIHFPRRLVLGNGITRKESGRSEDQRREFP